MMDERTTERKDASRCIKLIRETHQHTKGDRGVWCYGTEPTHLNTSATLLASVVPLAQGVQLLAVPALDRFSSTSTLVIHYEGHDERPAAARIIC